MQTKCKLWSTCHSLDVSFTTFHRPVDVSTSAMLPCKYGSGAQLSTYAMAWSCTPNSSLMSHRPLPINGLLTSKYK